MAWRRWKKVDNREESIFVAIVTGKEQEAIDYIHGFFTAYAKYQGEEKTTVDKSSLFPTEYKRLHNKKEEIIRACHEGCDKKYLNFCKTYFTKNPTDAVEITFGHKAIEQMRNDMQMEFLGFTPEKRKEKEEQLTKEGKVLELDMFFPIEYKEIKVKK